MVKEKENWHIKYEKIVRKHHANQKNVTKLNRQLNRLMVHHTHLKLKIFFQRDKFLRKVKMMEELRKQLSIFRIANKGKITAEKQLKLDKMEAELPSYTLMDRIRLMELSMELPKCQESSNIQMKWFRQCTSKDMQRLFGTVRRNSHALYKIYDEFMKVISDIHDLQTTIQHVKNTPANMLEIKPFVQRMKWMEPTKKRPEVKATIAMLNRKHRQRTLINVHPTYILKNISTLMPNMYHYLDEK